MVRFLAFAALITGLCCPLAGLAEDSRDSTVFRDEGTGALFLSGGEISYAGEVGEDVFAAGFSLDLTGLRAQDVLAAGFTLVLRDITADDVIAAGFNLSIGGEIADDVIAAGNSIVLSDTARLGGGAILAGQEVTVRGSALSGMRIAAEMAVIDAEIAGDVAIEAMRIEIGPNTRIAGVLRHSSFDLSISPDAEISEIVGGPPPERDVDLGETDDDAGTGFAALALAGFAFLIAQFVLAACLYLLSPPVFHAAADRLLSGLWAPLGLGAAVLIATPVIALMVAATVIGGLVGLYGFGAYLLLLAPGGCVIALTAAQFLRRRLAPDAAWPPGRLGGLGMILGGMLALWLISLIPLIGGLLAFAAAAAGVGALLFGLRDIASRPAQSPA